MTTNDILAQIHAALVDKVQSLGTAGERAKLAADIGAALTRYANLWTEAYANDAKVDEIEADLIKKEGARHIYRLPCIDSWAVKWAWEGKRILFWKIPSVRSILADKFALKFK